MRIVSAALTGLLVCGLIAPAEADERPDVVGVIPFVTGEGLAIYSKPAADALASRLRDSGLRVQSLPLSGDVPPGVGLVIDAGIQRAGDDRVILWSEVRDPRRARAVVPRIRTRPQPLARIDEAAADLAAQLAPKVSRALDELATLAQREASARRERRVIRLPTSVVRGDLPRDPRGAADELTRDERPTMLVLPATGEQTDSGIVTRHGYWIAERLGYRPVTAERVNIADVAAVTHVMGQTGAGLALSLHVREVELDWRGVLTGRGRVRVVLIDGRGQVLFDRTARTDTLVCSRGEGPSVLVHYVAEQVAEIVTPHLKRLLEMGTKVSR